MDFDIRYFLRIIYYLHFMPFCCTFQYCYSGKLLYLYIRAYHSRVAKSVETFRMHRTCSISTYDLYWKNRMLALWMCHRSYPSKYIRHGFAMQYKTKG